jgi:hypothetical protein
MVPPALMADSREVSLETAPASRVASKRSKKK